MVICELNPPSTPNYITLLQDNQFIKYYIFAVHLLLCLNVYSLFKNVFASSALSFIGKNNDEISFYIVNKKNNTK